MDEDDVRIEHIKIKDLINFATGVIENAKDGQFVPITMQRAVAHAHNPYADPDDVGLLAAIDGDNEVVGYFGIMPLRLRRGDQLAKVHWFTTWSVSGKVRGKGVGSRLMKEALTLNLDYLIVGSVHARRVCRNYGFWERDPLTYYWLDVSGMGRLNPITWILRLVRKMFHVLRIKRPVEISSRATRWLDQLLSPWTQKIFWSQLERIESDILRGIQLKEVSQIEGDLPAPKHRPEVELHRGVEAVNWMLRYPWVVETGKSPTEKMDYYFSDSRPMYELIAVEVYAPDGQNPKGFAVFSVTQKSQAVSLKTLDFQFSDPSGIQYVLALALKYGRQHNADTIELPAEVAAHLPGVLGKLLLQPKERIYQCMPKSEDSPLAQAWKDMTLHLYDGDMAFS